MKREPRFAGSAGSNGAIPDLRAEPLMCVPALLREFGVDPDTVLRRAGLEPGMLEDPERRLPYASVGSLLATAAQFTGCAHFGLLMGQRAGDAVLGLIGQLATHARTVRAALRAMVVHFHLHDRGAVLMVSHRGEHEAEIAYAIHRPDIPGTAHIEDGAMAIALQFLHGICGPGWRAREVTLAHAQHADATEYRRFFGAPVHFDSACSTIVFDARWLDAPVCGADAQTFQRLSALASHLAAQTPLPMAECVREALTAMVIGERPSAERVASSLGISRRTLHRRLAEEGTAFRILLEDARIQLACMLLSDTRMTLAEVATTLDYSEAAAFSRAFKAWTRYTPRQYRTRTGIGRR